MKYDFFNTLRLFLPERTVFGAFSWPWVFTLSAGEQVTCSCDTWKKTNKNKNKNKTFLTWRVSSLSTDMFMRGNRTTAWTKQWIRGKMFTKPGKRKEKANEAQVGNKVCVVFSTATISWTKPAAKVHQAARRLSGSSLPFNAQVSEHHRVVRRTHYSIGQSLQNNRILIQK